MSRDWRRVAATVVTVLALVLAGAPVASAQPESPPAIKVVAIGDSIGFGLWDLQGGYARRYVSLLEDAGHSVDFTNLAVPGWETDDLLEAVRDWHVFRSTLSDADIVLAEIGGNDLDRMRTEYLSKCTEPDVDDVITRAGTIARTVKDLIGENGQLLTFTLYNPYVDQDRGVDSCPASGADGTDDLTILNASLQEYNDRIRSAPATLLTYAEVYEEFNLRFGSRLVDPARKWYLAFDDFHPNFRGHQKIADLLFEKTTP